MAIISSILNIFSDFYRRTFLSRIEDTLRHIPNPYAIWLIGPYKILAYTLLLVFSPLLIVLMLIYVSASVIRTLCKNKAGRLAQESRIEDAPGRVAILLQDWPKCGSTTTYTSQIRSFRELGWSVDLVIFSDHFLYIPEDQYFAGVYSRATQVLPLHDADTIYIVGCRVSFRYLWHLAKMKLLRKSLIYRHCNLFTPAIKGDVQYEKFLKGADIIVCNRVTYIEYLDEIKAKIYLETHDIMCETQALSDPKTHKMDQSYELSLASRADLIGCFTEKDEAFYEKQKETPVIRSCFDIGAVSPIEKPHGNEATKIEKLIFFGDNHPQNVAGLNDVLPHLPLHYKLSIAGRVCDAFQGQTLAPNIRLLGFVDDLFDVIGQADVVIIPDYHGTGISIKTLQAMCLGMPIYCTSNALRGLPDDVPIPTEAIATKNNPHSFFAILHSREQALLKADWSKLRRYVTARYSGKAAANWAKTVLERCGYETSGVNKRPLEIDSGKRVS